MIILIKKKKPVYLWIYKEMKFIILKNMQQTIKHHSKNQLAQKADYVTFM